MATILRAGLLDGLTAVWASAGDEPGPVAGRLTELGAAVTALAVDPLGDEPEPPEACDALVWDGAQAFAAAADPPSIASARAALDGAWLAARPVAAATMIPEARGGKIVLLAPPPGGPFAEAARAGLENLARVTSIEWARFEIKIVAIHPGAATAGEDLADLVAYLAGPGGDYASGCVFSLR